jgi:glycosyltransferase involved in cell wall biosynthesis
MKVLLLNYHHFIHGGPDRYLFNVSDVLRSLGHEVLPFSFDYDETIDTPFRRYFPEPVTGRGPCLLANQRLSTAAKCRAVTRMFYNRDVNRRFRRIIREQEPDFVYSIYLSSSMLPNLLKIAKYEFGLPVLYRLSDFHMSCGSYLFFREGRICQECLRHPSALVAHRCMQHSFAASLLRFVQMRWLRRNRWRDAVDLFVCPSAFMKRHLIEDENVPAHKVRHLPTFAPDLERPCVNTPSQAKYMLYFGKVSPEKGVAVLLQAYNRLNLDQVGLKLKVVGSVSETYRTQLYQSLDSRHRAAVDIPGALAGEALWNCVRGAQFIVQPALWFENMPNTFLESMSLGKAIIASDLGRLPELVEHEVNGLLVPPGDIPALSAAIARLALDPESVAAMQIAARNRYLTEHTLDAHSRQLSHIISELPLSAKSRITIKE